MKITPNTVEVRPRRALNLKAVLICVVVFGAVSFGLRRLHSRQMVRTTSFLRQAADDAVREGSPHEAIQALERYLAFSHDPKALQTLAKLLDEHATDIEMLRTAYAMNEGLLLNDADNGELLLRQAELAIRLERFSDADSHLTALRTQQPSQARVWYLSGVVAQQAEQTKEAVDCYQTAIQHDCSDADCYAQLVFLQEQGGVDSAESDRLLTQMTTRHPSADASRVRAVWLMKHTRTNEAVEELWNGLRLAPGDVRLNSLLISALDSLQPKHATSDRQTRQKLLQHLQDQLTQHPGNSRLRLLYAHAQWQSDEREAAVETLRAGIARNPQAFELQEVMIDYLVSRGDAEQAEAAFRRLPRTALDHSRWHFLEGRIQMAAGQWNLAAASFDRAAGFSEADERIRHRSRMCQAVCRREQGDQTDALETYRELIHARPGSRDTRLGMAATWLESGRIDLAIAEYRQLQDVPGVPELLASLLIRNTLRQPSTRRSWREAEALLRDTQPVITDETQRTLLQADLLFAQGRPARALRLLDDAVLQHPDNVPFRSSRRRVLKDSEGVLQRRMKATLADQPVTPEAHITLLRLAVHELGVDAAVDVLKELADGPGYRELTSHERLVTVARVAERVAEDLRRFDEADAVTVMLDQAEQAWIRLAEQSSDAVPQAVAFVARHRRSEQVLKTLKRLTRDIDVPQQARSWLTALTNTSDKDLLKEPVEQALRQCVIQDPADLTLRQIYVEYLLQFAAYDDALTIERQILQREPRNVAALSRGAWILTMSGGDHTEALQLSENASRVAPANSEVRITRALVLTHSDVPDDALPVFGSVPEEARSPESFVYEALALLRAGRTDEAAKAAEDVQQRYVTERWRPADRRLLKEVISLLSAADVAGR